MRHCGKKAVTINVTNRCNLRCTYCMASSAEEQCVTVTIPLEFAKRGIIDALEGHPTGIKAEKLRFFAPGEPTQDMEIIRQCVEYARAIRPDLEVELQTNGVFLTREDAFWIAKNINMVWFSLDGPDHVNDVYRPDEFGVGRTKDSENFLKVCSQFTKVGIRSTVVEETVDEQDALVEYYHQLGVKYLALNPVIRSIKRGESGQIPVNKISC